MRRVLVTRPEPGASRTAARLASVGFDPVLLPLTRIVPLPQHTLPSHEIDVVVISSANAVRYVSQDVLARIRDVDAYAVGARTGAEAQAAGLKVVDTSAGDAEGLFAIVKERASPGSQVLLLCGRVRRNILEHGLAEKGFGIEICETYDTLSRDYAHDEIEQVLGGKPVDDVLLYSGFAAREFAMLAAQPLLRPLVERARVIAISSRTAACLPPELAARIAVASSPTEEAMLSLLV